VIYHSLSDFKRILVFLSEKSQLLKSLPAFEHF
jgi:hypothetical protein